MIEKALDDATTRPPRTAQEAALLTIASLDLVGLDRVDPRWSTLILKRQRFDGGWDGEPFAAAPNRGASVTWYASATLTTALCYDALVRASSRSTGSIRQA